MKLYNEFQSIRDWAAARGLYKTGDVKTQYVKFQEEAGELAVAILKDDQEGIADAIGDCIVVLTNLAHLRDLSIEECINGSYEIIKSRTGKMVDGNFVKDK